MENKNQVTNPKLAKQRLLDAYNDDYWQKEYGVSSSELHAAPQANISAKILDVSSKNKETQYLD